MARLVANGASAADVADAIVAIWSEIDAALTPILAAKGCALLYQRSLQRTAASFPWLTEACGGAHGAMDLSTLRGALSGQDPSTAAAAGTALLDGFRDQLASLIGASLTECLLGTAWTHAPDGIHPEEHPR